MEISALSNHSIKIKTKNSVFVLDPDGKNLDADALIYTKPQDNPPENKLVIEGAGEYEVGGVYIKGEKVAGVLVYEFTYDSKKLLVVFSPLSLKSLDTEDYSVVIVKADEKLDSTNLSTIGSELVIVYGPSENVALEAGSVKHTDKVNLKKIDELKGFTIYLTK